MGVYECSNCNYHEKYLWYSPRKNKLIQTYFDLFMFHTWICFDKQAAERAVIEYKILFKDWEYIGVID